MCNNRNTFFDFCMCKVDFFATGVKWATYLLNFCCGMYEFCVDFVLS